MNLKDKGYEYYAFGLYDVKENRENSDIVDIFYGEPLQRYSYHVHKNRMEDLLKALLYDIDECEPFSNFNLNANSSYSIVDYARTLLKGRIVIFVTDPTKTGKTEYIEKNCKDLMDYMDLYHVVGLTSIGLDGELMAKTEEELFKDDVPFDELYSEEYMKEREETAKLEDEIWGPKKAEDEMV